MTTKTIYKTISFDKAMKIFKKYVSKSETRPILKLVNFDGKYFYATDSHTLIRVNAEFVSDFPENLNDTFLYDPKEDTSKNINQSFPDVSRIIPQKDNFNSRIELNGNIKEFIDHIKEAKKIVNKRENKVLTVSFTQEQTELKGSNKEETETYEQTLTNVYLTKDSEEIKLHVNATYLLNALESAKQLSKVSNEKVEVKMISNMRPIVITQENVFDILVLPVRIY